MVNENRRRNVSFGFTTELVMGNIDLISDRLCEEILCNCVRPISKEEYKKAMLSNVEKIPTHLTSAEVSILGLNDRGSKIERKWAVENYDHFFSGYVDRMLQEIETYDGYCRRTKVLNEEKCLPELKYGKDGEQGVYQIALKCFKPHDEHFKTIMGPSSLHKIADLQAFVELFRGINDDYTRQARALRQAQENARPPRKLDELYDELQVNKHQKMFVDGKRENRSELSIMKRQGQDSPSSYTASTKLEAARVNSDGEWEIMSGHESGDEEEQSNTLFKSFNWETPRSGSSSNAYSDVRRSDLSAASGRPQFSRSYAATNRQSSQSSKFSDRRHASGDGQKPVCFFYALHGKCEKGDACPFKHDAEQANKWLNAKSRVYTSSPLYKQLREPSAQLDRPQPKVFLTESQDDRPRPVPSEPDGGQAADY
jgi:hypothetical protein